MGRVIMDFYGAQVRGAQAAQEVLDSLACHGCGDVQEAYAAFEQANHDAFEKRKNEELKQFPEQALEWRNAAADDLKKEKGKETYDDLDMANACRRPEPPARLIAPAAGKVPEAAAVVLAGLAKDVEMFNKGLKAEYEAFLEMMPHERAFDCREVLEAYEELKTAEFAAFKERQDRALAEVAEYTVEWKVAP